MALSPDHEILRLKQNLTTIDRTYKPPPQIQLSRATRDVAARRYYTDVIFMVHAGEGREDIWLDWLSSLPHAHVLMMRTYYKTARKNPIELWRRAVCMAYWDAEAMWTLATAVVGAPVFPRYLFTNVEYKDEEDAIVKEVWRDGDFLVNEWIANGAPTFTRIRIADLGLGDKRRAGDEDDDLVSGHEKDESDEDEVDPPGKTRSASKNPFDVLAD
ncbi:hypothetical protein M409DRAFT_24900 [Zasmidium cellare ATCC 36951]|uniref:Uncharacterized protein n=1 Tax=Zasmidium cellare ATCC 36951 TaxID=1080233 RepID=A0A6A6CH44_ZASCE|nr:uncharacterized protein M409DRAFT_24900 [Zasmidium cellare ATCC 36951]KAF2164999.1 hypothetical protein M409DRAFT_24900 [Zasmidium cellare ATCC 36951]